MKKLIFWIFLMIIFSGCEKLTEWPLKDTPPDLVVVDGIITGQPARTQALTLTRPVAKLNAKPAPVIGATLQISDEDSVFHMTESPTGSGIYRSVTPFYAREGKNYTLLIFSNQKVISAKASIAQALPFDFLSTEKDENTGMYHISWVASSFSTASPAMWEVLINWSGVHGFEGADSASTHARLLFYTLPTLDVSEIFAPAVENISFPFGTIITEIRYSLTSAHAEFVREILLETQWQGGLFNSVPANVHTNLSAGGSGFFAVCGITSQTRVIR